MKFYSSQNIYGITFSVTPAHQTPSLSFSLFIYLLLCSVLLTRGADFNLEDKERMRPDDLAMKVKGQDCDSSTLIQKSRSERMAKLKELIEEVCTRLFIIFFNVPKISKILREI